MNATKARRLGDALAEDLQRQFLADLIAAFPPAEYEPDPNDPPEIPLLGIRRRKDAPPPTYGKFTALR